CRHVKRRGAGLATLCGNDDHPICATRPVDGCCRCVFENIHTGDVIRIEVTEWVTSIGSVYTATAAGTGPCRCTRQWDTVDHKQRVVSGADGRVTPNPHGGRTTWLTAVVDHHHARRAALNELVGRRNHTFIEIFGLHRCDRTCEIPPPRCTITDHHHLIETIAARYERKVNRRHRPGHRHGAFGLLIANVRNYQRVGSVGNTGEAVIPLLICTGLPVQFDNVYRCTGQRLLVFVRYRSLYASGLSMSGHCPQQCR